MPVCDYFTYASRCIFYICQYVNILHVPVCAYFTYASGYSRMHLDRLKKYTNYKVIKNNTNFGQVTGIQEKLDTTCK